VKLSVSMIVRNEESCLAKCLQSVEFADEIVVVDTGSTDRTKEIAGMFSAKLYDFPWVDDFAAARNHALSKCTGDWVISIDADEELEPGGIEKIRKEIENAGDARLLGVQCTAMRGGETFVFPRVFKRDPEIFWEGAIHNHLNVAEMKSTGIVIRYGYSEAHKGDPDRSLRILKKVVEENPASVRETFYLAREYWYRKDYDSALKWYGDYLTRATWAPEMAESWLMSGRCLLALGKWDMARDCALQAIKINNDFQEALLFLAETSGPKNSERWKLYASLAQNEDVLFVRLQTEMGSDYYDKIFSDSKDMSRYELILQATSRMTHGRVLDVCCGTGELGKYLDTYRGIDFSEEAVRGNPRLACGNVYEEDLAGYDTYVILEALEHLDDLALLARIPAGSKIIFSVPSFKDPSHLRTYNERIVRTRYAELMKIRGIVRYNWTGSKWDSEHSDTTSYILLVRGEMRS